MMKLRLRGLILLSKIDDRLVPKLRSESRAQDVLSSLISNPVS